MDTTTIIRIVAGILFIAVFVVMLVVYILYITSLSRALSKCSESSRTMQPGMVWLLLVPLVGLVWQFFVVIGLADSLGNEFRAREVPNADPKPGKSVGIAMCVCAACGIVPLVNLLAFPAYIVLWIIYWVKIGEFSRRLDLVPATNGTTLYATQETQPGLPPSQFGTGQIPPLSPQSPISTSRSVPIFVWILVGLAAFIPIMLILALIAIPTLGSMKKHANETSAIQSMRAISMAEMQYETTYPENGYACTLAALGGDPSSGGPSPTAAQMLAGDLASGYKPGYIFTIGNCTKVSINGTDRITGYTIFAVPQTVGKTGNRGFCSDQFGTLKYDPTGGTNCTQALGQ